MVTFKPVVFSHHRRSDGTYNVKIRLTFRRKSKYLPTTIYAESSQLTRSLDIKSGALEDACNELIRTMRAALASLTIFDLEGKDVEWVADYIARKVSAQTFSLDFFDFADSFIKDKKPSTASPYKSALSSFERFLGRREIDINDIRQVTISQFYEYLLTENKYSYNRFTGERVQTKKRASTNTAKGKLVYLMMIFNAAKEKYNTDEDIVIPRSPFKIATYKSVPSKGQRSLSEETVQRFISDALGDWWLALGVVSFALMGANVADLYAARAFRGDEWIYQRAKTKDRRADHSEMRVTVPPELEPYLALLRGRGGWWLNNLHKFNKDVVSHHANYHIRRWCERNGIEPFTMYAFRHSWATFARRCGVEKATVDECLAHVGDFRLTDIYAERDWSRINAANRKVLDLFTWSV